MRLRPRLPFIWYLLAVGTALTAVGLGLWALRFNQRLEDELARAARAQSELLARDFGEEFLVQQLTATNAVFGGLAPLSAWSPELMDSVFLRAQRAHKCQCQPAYVAHAAFLWSSREADDFVTLDVPFDRVEPLRIEVAKRADYAPKNGATVLVLRSGPTADEHYGMGLFQRLPDGTIRAIGIVGEDVHPWLPAMQPIIAKVGGARLGTHHRTLAAWQVISPGGGIFFAAGAIDPTFPSVENKFRSRQFASDSLPQHLLFLAKTPAVEVRDDARSSSDPDTSPWIVVAQVSPAAMSNALYGSERIGLTVIIALVIVATSLSAAMVAVARRLVRQVAEREAFATTIAHDLRTPLTQILLHAESLQLGRAAEGTRREAARVIAREARRLVHLVENALTFVRRKGTPPRLAFALVDVAHLVDHALAAFEPIFTRADMHVQSELAKGLTASLDADAFSQVMGNLLENAVRFGPRGQVVGVTVVGDTASVVITVRDQGPGIPAAERDTVFLPFVRGSTSGGTGIGLAVARQLVELMNGTIEIREPRGGSGAEVSVVLPLAQGTAPPATN